MSSYRKRNPFWSRPPRNSSPFVSQRSSADAASRPTGFSGREYERASNFPKTAPRPSPATQVRSCTASKWGPTDIDGHGNATSTPRPCGSALLAAWSSVIRDCNTLGSRVDSDPLGDERWARRTSSSSTDSRDSTDTCACLRVYATISSMRSHGRSG
eukprot:scaffold80848_cov30-Tisochrysis_lutea.AAC.6